jgi:hypothetical protein
MHMCMHVRVVQFPRSKAPRKAGSSDDDEVEEVQRFFTQMSKIHLHQPKTGRSFAAGGTKRGGSSIGLAGKRKKTEQ